MAISNELEVLFIFGCLASLSLLQVGQCCPSQVRPRTEAGGFLVRLHIEKDIRNVPQSWRYRPEQYPADFTVNLTYLQRGDRCDPTSTSYREFARQITVNFTKILKIKKHFICDANQYLECDKKTRRCDCMTVYAGFLVDKEGPYYLRWDENKQDCRAAEGSFCDRKFKCGGNPGELACNRVRCTCQLEDKKCSFVPKGYLKPKILQKNISGRLENSGFLNAVVFIFIGLMYSLY